MLAITLITLALYAGVGLRPAFAGAPQTLGTITVHGTKCPNGTHLVSYDRETNVTTCRVTGMHMGIAAGGTVPIPNGTLTVGGNTKPAAKTKDQRNPCNGNAAAATLTGSHPIELSDRSETLALTLFQLPGEMGLSYSLYYTSPRGWYDSLGFWLDTNCGGRGSGSLTNSLGGPTRGPLPCNKITLHRPDGAELVFSGTPGTIGGYPVQGGSTATLTGNADGSYTLHDEDGTTQIYSSGGALLSIKDESGIGWTFATTVASGISTTTVTATDGASFTVAHRASSLLRMPAGAVTVTDPAGNVYTYVIAVPDMASAVSNNTFELMSLTLPGSPVTTMSWKYATNVPSIQYLLTEEDYNGVPYFYITYDGNGYATGSHEANGNRDFSIVYTINGSTMTAAVTNPLGYTIIKQFGAQYGGEFLLTSVSGDAMADCGATTSSYAYDGNGDMSQALDNDGHTTTYDYAANGQLQRETEAAGTAVARTTDYVWDPDQQLNRLLSVTVEGESEVRYTYNARNRLASVTRTNLSAVGTVDQSLTTTYAYTLYPNGMVEAMTVTQPSPNGSGTTTYAYDPYGNLTSVTDGLGHVTTYSNYNGLGEVGKVVGPNGAETDYTWDARGRMASKTTHPNGGTATWTCAYDGFGLLASVTAPDGEVTTWTRDPEMRVTAITHNDKDGTSTETFSYDANGDVTSDVVSRGGVVGQSATYLYDALGRVYQARGAHGQSLTYAYDGNGNVLSVTDALGHVTRYTYDALNRVATATDATGGVTRYAYDADDDVVQVTDPRGLVTTYAHDGFGHLWQQVSPDTGTTTLSYDAYGRLASKTRADGTVTTFAYDALNRLTEATADGTHRQYTWDICTDGKGRLCAASDSRGDTVGYSYSPEGWITARAFTLDSAHYAVGYAYDDMGHLDVVDYPDGNKALYDYADGVVADVRMQIGGNTTYAASGVTYTPMDRAMAGWTSHNGLANTITYDSDGRPVSISVPGVESLAFGYDAANRITHITDGMNNADSQGLSYDAAGRLTGFASSTQTASFSYDADGN